MKTPSSAIGLKEKDKLSIVIIGAGLAGLTCSIMLQRQGYRVTVIEKKQFPFHRVCGEYVSNEVLPFLKSLGLDIESLKPSTIQRIAISSVSGKVMETHLEMGGFGLSRYRLDNYLYQQAVALGVTFLFAKAHNVLFKDERFSIDLSTGITVQCHLAIAAYGKRANLDQKLNRKFFSQRSPYLGVKYHIKSDLPNDQIRLDNFEGGYCGICKIEAELYNLCYLSETKNLRNHGSISEMERSVLSKNPRLKQVFENSEFIFQKPEVINEISFERKSLVEDHILFCGDSAGMITPLCGNGMAMAIHSAKILAECIINNGPSITPASRLRLENHYKSNWNSQFSARLRSGRLIQQLFLNAPLNNLAITLLKRFNGLSGMMVRTTHGRPF